MERIQEFLAQYIDAEFAVQQAKYNKLVSDSEFESIGKSIRKYHHSIWPNDPSARGFRIEDLKEDEFEMEMLDLNLNRVKKRIVFQIRKFRNPKLGDALARVITDEELYAVYLDRPLDDSTKSRLGMILYLAATDEGLRFIYKKSFTARNGTWRHSHDHQPTQVLDPGTLVETLRLTAPEDPMSLAEYNRD